MGAGFLEEGCTIYPQGLRDFGRLDVRRQHEVSFKQAKASR